MNLSILGLNNKEQAIYLAILELGEVTATDVAKKAKIKRTTFYNIIPSLLERGLVQTTIQRGVKYFFIEDVKNILRKEETRIEEIKSLLPKLQALHNIIPQKPSITLHEGVGGLQYIYEDIIKHTPAGGIVKAYAGTTDVFNFISKDFLNLYLEKRIKSKIQLQIITNKNSFGNELSDKSKQLLREVKMLENKDFNFQGETIIYAGKVAFISYKENYLGVIIESQQIYQMHKGVFDELWARL